MRKPKMENRGQLAITMAVAALIAFFTLTGTSLSARWEVFYEANVPPDDVSLGENVWTTISHQFYEIDPPGILHIKTEEIPKGCAFSRDLVGLSKVTIEARIKVVTSPKGDTATMGISGIASVLFFDDKIQLCSLVKQEPTYDVDMTNGYHIVRLVIDVVKDDIDAKIYLDNKAKPILEHQSVKPEFGKPLGEVRLHLSFGCRTGMELSESYWDYIAYTTEGTFSPSELHSPRREPVEPQGNLITTWGVIRTVQRDLGFDKIQTLRFRQSKSQGENMHWDTVVTFKRPSYIRNDTRAYEKGELVYKLSDITDSLNRQSVKFDAYDNPTKFYPMIPLKAGGEYRWDTHPLFEFRLLNPEVYSEIEKSVFEGVEVYILRSKKVSNFSLECTIAAASHRIIHFLLKLDNRPLEEMTDFKYEQIAPGVWYPTSYVIKGAQKLTRVIATEFEVNIDIPNETFMFLPEKADTKK